MTKLTKRQIDMRKLAKLFVEHDYFSDEKSPSEAYGVLFYVYDALTKESKDELLKLYKEMKER